MKTKDITRSHPKESLSLAHHCRELSFHREECHLRNPVTDYSLFALPRMCNLEGLAEKCGRRELASSVLLHRSIATLGARSMREVIRGNREATPVSPPESEISRCVPAVPN